MIVLIADSFGFHEFDFLKYQGKIADFVDNSLHSSFLAIVKSFGVIAIAALLAVAAIVAKSAIDHSLSNMENLNGVDFENFDVVGWGVAEIKNNFNETALDVVVVSKERENSFLYFDYLDME